MRKTTSTILALAAAVAIPAAAWAAAAAPAGKTVAKAVVNGKAITLSHAYLFHAPDNWNEKQQNAVVIVTQTPLDPKRLDAAKTLAAALEGSGQRVQVEIRPDRKADIQICHDGFGDGMCYSTSIFPEDWKIIALEPKRAAGEGIQPFMGKEETVFEKYRLDYQIAFDAPWVKDFAARR